MNLKQEINIQQQDNFSSAEAAGDFQNKDNDSAAKDYGYYKKMALIYEDFGDYENAISSYYKAFLESGKSDYIMLERATKNLIESGNYQTAEKFLKILAGKIPDENYVEMEKEIYLLKSGNNSESVQYTDEFLELYLKLFKGRNGVYAVQYIDGNGKANYKPVREQFTKDILKAHLAGELTAGLYPLNSENKVKWFAFDIDISKHFLNNSTEEEITEKFVELREIVNKIYRRLKALNIHSLVEFSGNKGYHLWCFFEEPVHGLIAKKIAEIIMAKINISPESYISVEIFPKQATIEENGLGNLIKIPLGIHLKTNKRCSILNISDFSPVSDIESELKNNISFIPLKVIEATKNFIQKNQNSLKENDGCVKEVNQNKNYVKLNSFGKISKAPLAQKDEQLNKEKQKVITKQIELFQTTDISSITNTFSSDVKTVYEKCGMISYIVKKAAIEKHLTHDERLILLYSLAFIENGGKQAIHRVISECTDYKFDITEGFLKGKRENCMGCFKIRQRLFGIVKLVNCNCMFNINQNGIYPSPLLHINMAFKRNSYYLKEKIENLEEMITGKNIKINSRTTQNLGAILNNKSETIDEIGRAYIILKKQYIEILEKLNIAKRRLESEMEMKKVFKIELMEGIITFAEENGSKKLSTLFSPANLPHS